MGKDIQKMNLYIDFGGTNFRYRLDNGEVFVLKSKDIELQIFLDKFIQEHPNTKSINISFAGNVKDGKIISSANINIKNLDLKRYIKDKYNIKVKIDNDVNCAALAEFQELQEKFLAVFYIGTGFGSTFLENAQIIRGYNNQGGEIGHIPFKKTPFTCGCGRNDCIELSCSGSGIKKWCEYYDIDEQYTRLDLLSNSSNNHAKEIIDNFYNALAHAFHTSLTLFDFNHLVLGGSVGNNIYIKEFLQKEINKSAFNKRTITISLSTLKEGALEGTKYL